MSFFFPSSPSTSDATVSSLASSPRLGGVDELATPTHISESPRSPITATSTTRAPDSRVSGSPKAVGVKVIQNSNDSNNGNGHYYGDNNGVSVHPLSRAASDVYEPAAHTRRDHDHSGLSELGVNLERGVDRFLRLMVGGELSDSESSLSSFDDGSVTSGRNESESKKGKGKLRERERVVEDMDTSSSRTHRATATGGDVGMNSTGAAAHAVRASASSALQGTSIPRPLISVASPPIPPPDDEESRARARSHRRRSSEDPSRSRGTHSRKSGRRLVVHKRQEIGISRDFVLIVALCVGFACAIVLVARPAMMVLVQRGGGWDLD